MRYRQVPKRLMEETTAMVRLYLFLRHDVGLKENLSVSDLRQLLNALKVKK